MSSQQVVLQVIYPPSAASSFNIDYYLNSHVPMVKRRWGPQGPQSCIVTTGMKNAGYHVQTTLVWENMASLENVKDADVVREDVKIFTDIPSN
jgi:type IV secretory pathway protease TraF